jgi:hypothetical protein
MALFFHGRWIGETVGYESPAHIWEIAQSQRQTLQIETRWEGETERCPLYAYVGEEGNSFAFQRNNGSVSAILLDSHHFVIPGWDTNDRRGGVGPDYDVVFSRPGMAELNALEVYWRWKQTENG